MTTQKIKLFCILDGDSSGFEVKLEADDTIAALKEAIKEKKPNDLQGVDADKLCLFQVSIQIGDEEDEEDDKPFKLIEHRETAKKITAKQAASRITKIFGTSPLPEETIHVIVLRPAAVPAVSAIQRPISPLSRPSSPAEELESLLKKITRRFFADGSEAATFLKEYVKGNFQLPVTTTGIKGLPKARRRGKDTSPLSRPTLLFLDLPELKCDGSIPERFQQNVLLQLLKDNESRDVPVFGVSGCGKTRSVLELLCLQWGFYFNASDKDLGSNDMASMARLIDSRTGDNDNLSTNTNFARKLSLILFFTRLVILNFCLSIPNCQDTFSSTSWTILQMCPYLFNDIFDNLMQHLFDHIHDNQYSESSLTAVARKELLAVKDKLIVLDYSNFNNKSKLRIVVDEAQILGDKGVDKFESFYAAGEPRPMLSPILHGFRNPGGSNDVTIIYCGTGLSIRTLHWAMCSGDGVKEYGSPTFPHLQFGGFSSESKIQSFVERIKSQLGDGESKSLVDKLLPSSAVEMIYKRLSGRFRPSVTCIEGILSTCDPDKWETVIENTETMLTSWSHKERRGNLIGELIRVQAKIARHPEQFQSCASIEEALGLYLFRWCLLGEKVFILEDEAQLVEAAFGRIRIINGEAKTALDEPFVLEATKNYFRRKDPLFLSQAERAMLHSNNATVHGTIWETLMPGVFIETLRNKPFSSWKLLPNNTIPMDLSGDVKIVGYDESNPQLAITHKDITLHDFIQSQINKQTNTTNSYIPPFYFPSPQVSGPDIVFLVTINNQIYPVFTQLKLRQVIPTTDATEAITTTSSFAVQSKIVKEQKEGARELHDLCPSGKYISIVIAYPASVTTFQAYRPDPDPEILSTSGKTLDRIVIKVDKNNFPDIFPARHVQFLDRLKEVKKRKKYDEATTRSKVKKSKVIPDIVRSTSDPLEFSNSEQNE